MEHDFFRFLCGPFYDDSTHKVLKSNQNEKRLVVLNLGPKTVSFNVAHEVCRKCLDGYLVMREDVEKLLDYLPTWVGMQSRFSHWNGRLEWAWADGNLVAEEYLGYAKKFFVPKTANETTHFGVYALKSRNYFTFDTVMDWIALPSNEQGYAAPGTIDDLELERENQTAAGVKETNYYLVCERPIRSDCHYWNFTEESCINDKKYGCHNYISFMFQHPDGFDEKDKIKALCPPPKRRRQATRCPATDCVCPVTAWSQWSSCGSEMCSSGDEDSATEAPTRSRTREYVPHCPETFVREPLTQTEKCKVDGCDELLSLADATPAPATSAVTSKPPTKVPAPKTSASMAQSLDEVKNETETEAPAFE
uniref:C-type lectin domain-containing protein n=1 Tax=Romanomermis culicivorax TaxID=13658 RepID=A0A915IPP1_ROMCU